MHPKVFKRIAGAHAHEALGAVSSQQHPATTQSIAAGLLHKAACSALLAGFAGSAARAHKAAVAAQGDSSGGLLKIAGRLREIQLEPVMSETVGAGDQGTPYASTRFLRGAVPVPRALETTAAERGCGLYALCFSPEDVEGSFDDLAKSASSLAAAGLLAGLFYLPRRTVSGLAQNFAIITYGVSIEEKTRRAKNPHVGGETPRIRYSCPLDGFSIRGRPAELIVPGSHVLADSKDFVLVESLANGMVPLAGRRKRSKEAKAVLRSRVRFPIGLKLIGVVSGLLMASLSAMTLLASVFFLQDATVRVEENNHTVSQISAIKIDDDAQNLVSRARLLLDLSSGTAAGDAGSRFFLNNTDILYVGVPGLVSLPNEPALAALGINAKNAERAIARIGTVGSATMFNATPEIGSPALGVAVPYREAGYSGALYALVNSDRYAEVLKPRGIVSAWVVNTDGELILHSDTSLLAARVNFGSSPIVKAMRESPADNGQIRYRDSDGVSYIASFKRTVFGDLGVIASAPADKAFEAVSDIQRRNFYIMGAVLSLSIVLIYFFSRTLTEPVGILMDAALKVERGEYELDIRPRTRDELGALTETFFEMGRGLAEREKIKSAFGKFVNKTVAELAMKGEIQLGGERRRATIFFSDIRSFTSISESMQPEQVVEFLNQYLTRMVGCVNDTGGSVDKFIGDAIMAVWGVPVSTDRDPELALQASLNMRSSLQEFNMGRGGAGKPLIKIGCGLNTGPVLAGQIGSSQRMEYTVIGDTVNLASRIESLNKPFGTDILVSEYTLSQLRGQYIVEPMPMIRVKGKAEPLRVFAVIRHVSDEKGPRDLRDLREMLGIDDIRIDSKHIVEDSEEEKFEILAAATAEKST